MIGDAKATEGGGSGLGNGLIGDAKATAGGGSGLGSGLIGDAKATAGGGSGLGNGLIGDAKATEGGGSGLGSGLIGDADATEVCIGLPGIALATAKEALVTKMAIRAAVRNFATFMVITTISLWKTYRYLQH